MKESTRHTCVLIGIALFIIAAIMIYISYSTPMVYVTADSSTVPHSEYNEFVVDQTTTAPVKNAVVNLNTATAEQLMAINGIGAKTAAQILSYRDEIGGYTSVSQIKNIKNIGDKKFAKIAPYLTV